MAELHGLLLLLSLLAAALIFPPSSAAANRCPTAALAGFEAELSMVRRQLRGVVRVLDACSFSVSGFDMASPGPGARVRWWGAAGAGPDYLLSGFPVSDLPLDRTFRNDTLVVPLIVNTTWDHIAVLAVWDEAAASDFGHVVLRPNPMRPNPNDERSREKKRRRVHTQPTLFDSCRNLSPRFRLRWTLSPETGTIDIGLEAAVSSQHYMAFGWAASGSRPPSTVRADVVVAGFTEEGAPFAEDCFITRYSECRVGRDGRVEGFCPDAVRKGSDSNGLAVDNAELVSGHRRDGVSFVRFRRPLVSPDERFDVPVNKFANMAALWALGSIRPPDALRHYYLPMNLSAYGYLTLNVSEEVNDCLGPLEAEEAEGDQGLIIADGKTPLVVTSGPALRYPNPPNPSRVLYVNKKEAPLLRVKRGVPVKFSIQAGHDAALYITSDPVGGNAASRNASEVVYAGGEETRGVPAGPRELIWSPDRSTPDQLYYQSFHGMKMGWKVQVVDGGLSDMYNNSVPLDDGEVTFFWTLSHASISIAARGKKKSGYVAIGFGEGMVNSYIYVGWMDSRGKARVSTYWIDGRDASSVHPTSENLTYAQCRSEDGIITLEFTRALSPSCSGRIECKNVVDPSAPLKVIWARGARWSGDRLSKRNMHSRTSDRPVRVLLTQGSAEPGPDLHPVLAVHGLMMFVAWGMLIPGGIFAARYLKHVRGDGWLQVHVYLQYSGLAIILFALLLAAAELRGFSISSVHAKFGAAAITLACAQPMNAYWRPRKLANGEIASSKRIVWEYIHVIIGRCAIIVGVVALFSGMKHVDNVYDIESMDGLPWALMLWIMAGVAVVLYLEHLEVKRIRKRRDSVRGNWVLGNNDEDDSVDLLHRNGAVTELDASPSEMELEPLVR